VYIVLQRTWCTHTNVVGKRVENVIEIRAYIKGRSLLCLKPKDIHREVCVIYLEGQMSYMTVCRWVGRFKLGHQQLKDAAHTGRPATPTTKHNIEWIRQILKEDAMYTVKQLTRMTNLPLARVHCILKKHLGLNKNNPRWIPHLLTCDQKRSRI
jgi:transposase